MKKYLLGSHARNSTWATLRPVSATVALVERILASVGLVPFDIVDKGHGAKERVVSVRTAQSHLGNESGPSPL